MNKDIFDQLSADEQPVAAKLNSVSENMKVPQAFQWTLESQLMDTYKSKSQPTTNWFSRIIRPAGWAIAALIGFVLLNWTIRSLVPPEQVNPAAPDIKTPVESFEHKVRQGIICTGSLAVAHGFSVALTNEDKTAFIPFNQEEPGSEFRSFIWSTDGKQLAVLGNTRGSGNIYLAESPDFELLPYITNPDFGYLFDFAWSRDGKQFALWSPRLYLVNADATGLQKVQLDMQVIGTPQFAPDNQSIVFHGANISSYGLFEMELDDLQIRQISEYVEDASAFAFSPDGTRLAYMDMDRTSGGAVPMVQDVKTGAVTPLPGGPAIPKGSGSSIPDVANLSWSQDGTKLVFEFGRGVEDRAIYIANSDGSGMVKVVESAHAPTISSDGNCLAYISNKQVFLIDLASTDSTVPLLLAELPVGRGTPDFRLDKLQWQP